MANIPLIPGVQQTYARFRRRGQKHSVNFKQPQQAGKRSFRRRLSDRRKLDMRVKLERRAYQDRRNQQSTDGSTQKSNDNIGHHINTTA